LQRFDGVIIAQNDFSYRFNARLTRRLWRVAVEAQVGVIGSCFALLDPTYSTLG